MRRVAVSLPGGMVEAVARDDGSVSIGALSTLRVDDIAGAFLPADVLAWAVDARRALADSTLRLPALSAIDGGAGLTLRRTSVDGASGGAISLEFTRAGDGDRIAFTVGAADPALGRLIGGMRDVAMLASRLTVPASNRSSGAAPGSVRVDASGRPAGARPAAPAPIMPPRFQPLDRMYMTLALGTAVGFLGGWAAGAHLTCATPGGAACRRPYINLGFALASMAGSALGAGATAPAARCTTRERYWRAVAGALLGGLPATAAAAHHSAAAPALLVGEELLATQIAIAHCGAR